MMGAGGVGGVGGIGGIGGAGGSGGPGRPGAPKPPDDRDAFAQRLAAQRQTVQRAMAEGRRWYLRGVLMMAIGIVAAWRGGQLNYALGVVMVLLAGIAASLGRSVRRSAAASLEKIALMETKR